ncbi:hypothetical protein [Sphingomonas sp. 67-36]|uniref:thiolase family protein n=1 Tax=Sphingomonas sp. 67-36 TaxID=1895849 RepID=UPI0025D7B7BF|nr:hypothetical protein [Sphingomonas sp. 67-36]
MAALSAGYDNTVSGVTLDRFCGGGITAVNFAAAQVMSGMEDLVIAGGTEMMSYTGAIAAQDAATRQLLTLMGSHNETLGALHPQSHQGVCADAIASMEGIVREALDAVGLDSQRKAAAAIAAGRFDKSIVPVRDADGNVVLDRDEYPRPETTAEGLAALNPAFTTLLGMFYDEQGTTFRKQINRRYPDLDIVPVHHAGSSWGWPTVPPRCSSPRATMPKSTV